LPHYAASSNCATLGGALAPRGTGTISTKYGKAEDMVISMQIVLPTGRDHPHAPVPAARRRPGLVPAVPGRRGHLRRHHRGHHAGRLPARSTRLLRAVLFDDLGKAIEAGRQMMTRRLQPFVIRLYDPNSTVTQVKPSSATSSRALTW
jgi:alkyldihydroxyacetonephosphate synthase